VEYSIKKHKDLVSSFQRFITYGYADHHLEQLFIDVYNQFPGVWERHCYLSVNFISAIREDDKKRWMTIGTEIFNLIMPLARDFDSRLLELIPQEIRSKFEIEEKDSKIVKWT